MGLAMADSAAPTMDCEESPHPFCELIAAGVLPISATPDTCGDRLAPSAIKNAERLYELAIPIDFPISGAAMAPKESSTAQKLQGTYYTPATLAAECTAICLDAYVERHLGIQTFSRTERPSQQDIEHVRTLFCGTKTTDLSCGVGRFLVAVVQYVQEYVADHLCERDKDHLARCLAENIHGFDVDPVALGIARMRVLNAIAQVGAVPNRAVLFNNFLHANPLIQRRGPYVAKEAVSNYLEGFLYSPALGRPENYDALRWDIVVGNPPWEKIRLEERTFFDHFMIGIVSAASKSARQTEIKKLKETLPHVHVYYKDMQQHIDSARKQIQCDPLFADSSKGELNTCALFSELALRSLRSARAVGSLLVKTSIVTHYAHRHLFAGFQRGQSIIAIYDFVNRAKYFPIDGRERFAWFMFGGRNEDFILAMHLERHSELRDASKAQRVDQATLRLLNPETAMIPSVQSPRTMQMLVTVYQRNSTFAKEYPTAKYGRLVHLTTHSDFICRENGPDRLPVIEGKFIERYNGRFSSFENVPTHERFGAKATAIKLSPQRKADPNYIPESRYFLPRQRWEQLTANCREPWSIFWRSTTSFSNTRTCIATLLPHSPAIQSLQMLQLEGSPPRDLALLLATMNSRVFDFLVRNKLAGIDLTQNVIKQIAVPSRQAWIQAFELNGVKCTLEEHVVLRVAGLLSEDARLRDYVQALNVDPYRCTAPAEILDRELDLLVATAYRLSASEFSMIIKTFGNRISAGFESSRNVSVRDRQR